MKLALLGCLVAGLLLAGTQDSELNVNRRYTVDSVTVAGNGWRTNVAEPADRLSSGLRKELLALVGQKLNPAVLDRLALRLKKELSAREVSPHVVRAEVPEHVRVEFEVKPATTSFSALLTKFAYNSQQGWSGGGMLGVTARQSTLLAGLISDGDSLNERFTGYTARYENKHLGTDRVGFRFDFGSYHEKWDHNTLEALSGGSALTGDAYRTRQSFAPTLTVSLAKPLTLEIGGAVERFGSPTRTGAVDGANALVASLRFHGRMTEGEFPQELFADYSLRAATRFLDSDFVFTSHTAGLHYRVGHGKHKLTEAVTVGAIEGRAPLSDRFVAGNSYYLRGWNKSDIDPIGGNRLVHNTVEYRYGPMEAFYDAGSVWDSGRPATVRHSLGIGVRESVFTLAVAFPVRSGHVEPVVMVGMIY